MAASSCADPHRGVRWANGHAEDFFRGPELPPVPFFGAVFNREVKGRFVRKTLGAMSLLVLGASPVLAQSIEIRPNASTPSVVGTPDNFSGRAVIDPLFPATEHTNATFGEVTFPPGARTVWHTHPAGQLLIITSGKGWVQQEG